MKYQDNNTTPRPGKKPPPPGKEYLCFEIYRKSEWAAQCAK